MPENAILKAVPILCAGLLCAACGDQPTSPADGVHATRASSPHAAPLTPANVEDPLPATLTSRAPMRRTSSIRTRTSCCGRRSRPTWPFSAWSPSRAGVAAGTRTPGPSFAIVEEGAVMITRYNKRTGCTSTVYGPGQIAGKTYYEVADEVHIARVVSATYAVEYKVRFNVPAGEPFGNAVTAPPC
jgi:hypothetical protein